MISRIDKYNKNSSNLSRTERNKELYDDLFTDTNYNNMVVIDDSSEIDISKIKEIIDNEKRKTRTTREIKKDSNIYGDLPQFNEKNEKKSYDINEVLKDAKSKRDIIEEASEKRKIRNYNFKTNEEIEKELEKTRKVYENLIKEEKELLNIMNTLTNVSEKDLALDIFSDLKEPDNKKNEQTDTVTVRQIKSNDDSREYSTDTFMFDTKDFEGVKEDIRNEVKKTNIFIKILILVLVIVCIFALAYIINMYLIK